MQSLHLWKKTPEKKLYLAFFKEISFIHWMFLLSVYLTIYLSIQKNIYIHTVWKNNIYLNYRTHLLEHLYKLFSYLVL